MPGNRPALKSKVARSGAYFAAPSPSHKFISSGCALLDCALGGGYPLGRVVNIVGDKSTGKTLLAIEACANLVNVYPDARIWYLEAESAFDSAYAEALGFPVAKVKFIHKNTVEAWFAHLTKILDTDSKAPGLYIVDSLDALSDDAEMERDIADNTYGAQKAKKMSELFRRLVRQLADANICLIVISQVRDAINVRFGAKYTRTGGKALDFYASQVVFLAQTGTIKKTIRKVERKVGISVRAKITKNKVGLPLREAEFSILFGFGVDDIAANCEWLKSVGKPTKEKDTERMSNSELASYRAQLAQAVRTAWAEVEESFLPSRKKYV